MSPQDEAAAILTRLFEALARANDKTLNARSRPIFNAPTSC